MAKSFTNTVVIKLGGSTLGSHDTTLEDLVTLQRKGVPLVVVHGGGQVTTKWLSRLGIQTKFVDGLRVTDVETLKVVVATLAGQVNKELVAAIHTRGGKAMGLSGVDGGLLEAEIKDARLGYVGEIVKVNLAPLETIIRMGYIPVVAPLSLQSPPVGSGEAGLMLNVNADAAAGEIAAALKASNLIFLTDVEGVRDISGKLIPRLSSESAKDLVDSGVASGGMIPKIEACIRALRTVRSTRIIDGRISNAVLREIEGNGTGTTIEGVPDGVS